MQKMKVEEVIKEFKILPRAARGKENPPSYTSAF